MNVNDNVFDFYCTEMSRACDSAETRGVNSARKKQHVAGHRVLFCEL